MAANDHTDFRWDDRVIESLTSLGRMLAPMDTELAGALARFEGYSRRYVAALAKVLRGEHRWVDGLGSPFILGSTPGRIGVSLWRRCASAPVGDRPRADS